MELGLPWKARDLWLGLSSPFFDVEKVDDADPLPVRRPRHERAAPELRAALPGAAPGRPGGDRARHLPGPVARHRDAELPEGPLRALPRLVRPLPAARRAAARRPQARGDVAPRRAALRPRGAGGDAQGPRRRTWPKATAEFAKTPGQRRRGGRAGATPRRPRPVPRGDRRLHARPREAPERRTPLPPPRPPLHHGPRARQGRSPTSRGPRSSWRAGPTSPSPTPTPRARPRRRCSSRSSTTSASRTT